MVDFILLAHPTPQLSFPQIPISKPVHSRNSKSWCPQLAEHRQVFESTCSEIQQMVMFPNKVMWSMTWSCLGGLKCLLMLNSKKASDIAQESKGTSTSHEDYWAMQKKRTMWGRLCGARNQSFILYTRNPLACWGLNPHSLKARGPLWLWKWDTWLKWRVDVRDSSQKASPIVPWEISPDEAPCPTRSVSAAGKLSERTGHSFI